MNTFLHRRAFTFADLLVLVVLVPLTGVAMVGCYGGLGRSRETANRVKCASNLRQIGQAILIYSNDAQGSYPRTRYMANATPTWGTGAIAANPFADDGPAPNDVSAALFLLLRTVDITSEVFTCASTIQEKWKFGGGTALNWSNWNGNDGVARHLSYSYSNPYPDPAAPKVDYKKMGSLRDDFAVVADKNPGDKDGKSGVLAVTNNSSARDMRQGNSRNHDRDGQNVLYGDGHVEFTSNPFCGVQRDNIYTRRSPDDRWKSAAVVASPYDENDSVLLPCE